MFMHKTHACMYMQPNLRTHHLDWHVFLRDGHQVGVQMLRSIFVFHSLFLRREWWVLELLSYQVGLDRVHYIANQDSPNRGGSSPIFAREHVDGCREEPCNTCWLFGALGELMHVHASIYKLCLEKNISNWHVFIYSIIPPRLPKVSLFQVPGRISLLVQGGVIGDDLELWYFVIVLPSPERKGYLIKSRYMIRYEIYHL